MQKYVLKEFQLMNKKQEKFAFKGIGLLKEKDFLFSEKTHIEQ